MKIKYLALTLFLVLTILSLPSFAASRFGGRAQFYTPPEPGAPVTLMYGVETVIGLTRDLDLTGQVDYSTYTYNNTNNVTVLPAKVSLRYHPSLMLGVAPYIGGGLNYTNKTNNGASLATLGYQFLAGIAFNLIDFNADLGFEYFVPDYRDGKGSLLYGAGASGFMNFTKYF